MCCGRIRGLVLFSALRIPAQGHSGAWLTPETQPLLFSLPPLQGEGPPADSLLTYVPQTSALTYAPASRTSHPLGRPLQTLSRLQPGELSPAGGGGVQKQTLLRQLIAYLAMIPPSPTEAGPLTPDELLRVPWRKHGKRFSPPEDPTEPLGTGDGESASPPLGALLSTPSPSTCPASGVRGRQAPVRRAPWGALPVRLAGKVATPTPVGPAAGPGGRGRRCPCSHASLQCPGFVTSLKMSGWCGLHRRWKVGSGAFTLSHAPSLLWSHGPRSHVYAYLSPKPPG